MVNLLMHDDVQRRLCKLFHLWPSWTEGVVFSIHTYRGRRMLRESITDTLICDVAKQLKWGALNMEKPLLSRPPLHSIFLYRLFFLYWKAVFQLCSMQQEKLLFHVNGGGPLERDFLPPFMHLSGKRNLPHSLMRTHTHTHALKNHTHSLNFPRDFSSTLSHVKVKVSLSCQTWFPARSTLCGRVTYPWLRTEWKPVVFSRNDRHIEFLQLKTGYGVLRSSRGNPLFVINISSPLPKTCCKPPSGSSTRHGHVWKAVERSCWHFSRKMEEEKSGDKKWSSAQKIYKVWKNMGRPREQTPTEER